MALSNDILREVSRSLNVPSFKTRIYVNVLLDTLMKGLKPDSSVVIENFGTFKISKIEERSITAKYEGNDKRITLPPVLYPEFTIDEGLMQQIQINPALIKTPPPSTTDQFRSSLLKSRKIDVTYVELIGKTIPKSLLTYIPENIARKYQVVPFALDDKTLYVAMLDPENEDAFNIIRKTSNKIIKAFITTADDLNYVLDQYSSLQNDLKEIVDSTDTDDVEEVSAQQIEENENAAAELDITETAPAAKIVSSLLKRAVREKASDIHIEPQEEEVIVRFRMDGILRKILTLPKEIQSGVISRIKILSNLKIDETRIPQDGRVQIVLDGNKVDFRISTFPTVAGEKIVARVLDHSKGIITLENLGVTGRGFNVLDDNIKKSHGMVLVTGPTGSGKSTTLYAIIDKIKSETINIVTMEDPVEYRMPTVNQSQVNTKIDYTFATGLRAILRQDPNVVMVGEIRDKETADIAINAALTGHVVLSSLHTNDSAGALPRLLDMDIEPFLITSSVNAIIGQRLCRKLCDKCRRQTSIEPEILEVIKNEVDNLPQQEKEQILSREMVTYSGAGCAECEKTGFKGRVGIFEVLGMSEKIRQLTLKRASSTDIAAQAQSEGMITMKQDGIIKCLTGVTSIEEVWRVTKD